MRSKIKVVALFILMLAFALPAGAARQFSSTGEPQTPAATTPQAHGDNVE
ncbi:MAG: hypothetical protein H0X14_04240, partial [Acidobacteria bacterium]|nr:hypothetical protein [Acidobacteriota bacterium]